MVIAQACFKMENAVCDICQIWRWASHLNYHKESWRNLLKPYLSWEELMWWNSVGEGMETAIYLHSGWKVKTLYSASWCKPAVGGKTILEVCMLIFWNGSSDSHLRAWKHWSLEQLVHVSVWACVQGVKHACLCVCERGHTPTTPGLLECIRV